MKCGTAPTGTIVSGGLRKIYASAKENLQNYACCHRTMCRIIAHNITLFNPCCKDQYISHPFTNSTSRFHNRETVALAIANALRTVPSRIKNTSSGDWVPHDG